MHFLRTLILAVALVSRSAFADIAVSGGGLALEGVGGTFATGNLAGTSTAFAKDVLTGYAAHTIPHLNDVTYGNVNSWIAGSANSFAGISLGGTAVAVNRIAFGRDNTGVQTGDRVLDTYTLQYTTVANPDASTADASWTTIGTLTYTAGGPVALRHLFSFDSVNATGLRLRTLADGTCIDEIEIYNVVVSGPDISVRDPTSAIMSDGGSVDLGSVNIGTAGAAQTFTITNSGTTNLTGLKITKDGANASEFTVGALSNAALLPAGTRTFTVTFKPTKVGPCTAALHIASNAPGTKNPFDIQFTGTPVCPTITVNPPTTTTGLTSAAFSQSFTQTGGVGAIVYTTTSPLPSGITLSTAGKLAGKTTQLGVFPITVLATDSRGCMGTASVYTLTINRGPGAQLVVEEPVSNVVPSAGSVAFGDQVYGTSTPKLFTIKNTGTSVLNLGSITKNGPNADRFTLGALSGSSSIAVGDSRTLSVTYLPTAFGSNTAALHIPSNDLVTPIMDINLTGTSVCPTIVVTNHAVSNANTVEPFSQTFTQTGSIGTTTFTTTSTLPAGLTLSSAGVLSGTATEDGRFPISVTATGDLGCSGTGATYTLRIVRPPVVTLKVEKTVGTPLPTNPGTGLPEAAQGTFLTGDSSTPITYTITNTGSRNVTLNAFTKEGAAANDFTVSAPSSTTLGAGDTATFTIGFTPNRNGVRAVTLHISGSDGTLSSPYDILLRGTGTCPTVAVTNPTTSTATTGIAFSQSFTQTGGLGAITFTMESGSLPPGITLAANGVLSGTPARAGSFRIFVRATDSHLCTALGAAYTLVVAHGTGPQLVVEQPVNTNAVTTAKVVYVSLNDEDESNRHQLPAGLTGVTAMAVGGGHALALKGDSTVVAWGINFDDQTEVPVGLTDVQAIAAGGAYSLALKSDGTLVGWGSLDDDTIDVLPAAASDVAAIGAGYDHVLVAKTDGTVVAFGFNEKGQTDVPSGLTNVVAVAAGRLHSVALKSDGTVVAWGDNDYNQTEVPVGLTGVQAIACGGYHTLALKTDGTVVAWGDDDDNQNEVPAGLTDVKSIAADNYSSYALKHDGTLVTWGYYRFSNTFTQVQSLAAGYSGLLLRIPAVDFGEGKLGEPNDPVTLTLRNTGDAPLTLGAITLQTLSLDPDDADDDPPNEYLVAAPASSTIAPGGSTTLSVSYLPLYRGNSLATLHIASNDTATTPTDLLLSGTGVANVVTVRNPVIATGTVGQYFSQQFTQTGLVGQTSWGVGFSSGYPAGLDMNTDGRFSGVPTIAGTFPLHPHVNDSTGNNVNGPTYYLTINNAPAARFAVTAPSGVALQTGDTVNLGSSQVGIATAPRFFNVSNVGQLSASVGLISITGANSDDFTLLTLPASTALAPGASATFSIVFKAGAVGARTASLELPGSALAFPLTGTGSATPVTNPSVVTTAPDIAVEQPVGYVRTHTSTDDLGSLALNRPKLLTFTLRNAGTQPLTGLSASLAGTHAAQFSVVTPPPSTLAGGSSTTFVMQAKLTSLGAKTATLRIASNDPNESPFVLALTATGAPIVLPIATTLAAGSVSFSTFTGIYGSVALNGAINTQGALSFASFEYGLTTTYGSSTPPTNLTSTFPIGFNAGANSLAPHKTYHYRLRAVGDQGSAFGKDMTFTVPNRAPVATADNVTAARSTVVTIDVLANDTDGDNDKLTITSKTAVTPNSAGTVALVANKFVFTASSTFTTGTASFGYAIKDGFGGTASSTVTVTATPVTLNPPSMNQPATGGTYDVTANITSVTTVIETLPWLSTTQTAGVHLATVHITLLPNPSAAVRSGIVTINGQPHAITQLGVVKPSITPLSSTPYEAIVSGFFSLAIPLVDGPATYTATDLPPGLKLDNATSILSGTPTTGGTFNVVIKAKNAAGPLASDTAGIAAATVAFTIHVSDLDPNLIGTYHGLISPSQVAYLTPNLNIGARLEFTTTGVGAVTGQIIEGSTKVALKGQLAATVADPDHPVAVLTLIGPKTKLPMTLNVTLDKVSNTLAGHLYRQGTFPARTPVQGWRNTWTSSHPATDYAALHTLAIENVSTAQPSPDGFGFGSFTPALNTGLLTLKGTLADGSPLVCSTFIGPAGQVLCYQALYADRGSCLGKLTVATGTPAPMNNTLLGQFTWLKPAPLATSQDLIYRAGFGPLSLDVAGSTYPAPGAGERVLGLTTSAAKLAFTLGGLDTAQPTSLEFEQPLTITNPSATGFTNVATIASPLNSTTLPTLTATTGAFAGSFTLPGTTAALNRKAPFTGQIVKVTGVTQGYGHFLLPTGTPTVTTSPKLSGRVVLKP